MGTFPGTLGEPSPPAGLPSHRRAESPQADWIPQSRHGVCGQHPLSPELSGPRATVDTAAPALPWGLSDQGLTGLGLAGLLGSLHTPAASALPGAAQNRVLGQGQQGMFRGRWAKARSSGQQGGDREHPGSMLCGLWRPPRPPLTPGRLQRPCGDGRGECQHLPAYKALCLLHPSCHTHPSVCLCGTVRGVRLTCTQANLQVRPQAHVPEQAGWPSPPLHPPAAGSKGKVGVKRLLTEGETEAQEGHGPDTA